MRLAFVSTWIQGIVMVRYEILAQEPCHAFRGLCLSYTVPSGAKKRENEKRAILGRGGKAGSGLVMKLFRLTIWLDGLYINSSVNY